LLSRQSRRADRGHEALSRDLAEALDLRQLFGLQAIEVAGRADEAVRHEALDLLLPQALDVHRPA